MKQLILFILCLVSFSLEAQNYWPDGRAFVSENGTNRYTRALYGSHTDYRVETSDQPVFAIVKKGIHRNVRFRVNGMSIDSLAYCQARYADGQRSYRLTDPKLGTDTLHVTVVAHPEVEGVIWRFATTTTPLHVEAIITPVKYPKLKRNGDLGVDAPDAFDAHPDSIPECNITDGRTETYVYMALNKQVDLDEKAKKKLFDEATDYYRQLADRIVFDTPDPYINTLGAALAVAADGNWDGETWLHGCVGWRMPLAGWRAAYVGDVLGWGDRQRSHFNAYAHSQVTGVEPVLPHPAMDTTQNLARAEKRWGTPMYSNGYICRNPNRNDQMHHYDMNLNYIDELLWHFQYDADTLMMRRLWPVIVRHLEWERRNYDPDGDHLYDAYCCIWASDALYYNGGAVTHSSAYNYRANRIAARIADILGEDGTPYRHEADAILQTMNSRLWMDHRGVWAEYQDLMGLQRLHESPAVWSVYTPIDCGACSPEQAWKATEYIHREIPHIDVASTGLQTIATSNWMPYSWSINNVAAAEVMHTALAFFEAGRADEGYRLMMANVMDQMYYGASPANFGQVSRYDAARGECYRDFGDCIGISSRTLLQGLFGIIPQALDSQCVIRPGFPSSWQHASVTTPYLSYSYEQHGDSAVYMIHQQFPQPLKIILRQNMANGMFRDIVGTNECEQIIVVERLMEIREKEEWREDSLSYLHVPQTTRLSHLSPFPNLHSSNKYSLSNFEFNAQVADIFRQRYLSPRPHVTTLQIPVHGIGDWCHPQTTAEINDSLFRSLIVDDTFTADGIPFRTPKNGPNILFTSLWDNYPDSAVVPLKGRASGAWLLMAGTTNHMQSRIDNGLVVVNYRDGSADTLRLRNPDNWCPIEQDYFVDGKAFRTVEPRPLRVSFSTGIISRDLGTALGITGVDGRRIPGGAAQILFMPLDRRRRLRSLTLRTLSNDVVIGMMAVTLER